jgi:hypothetical protein
VPKTYRYIGPASTDLACGYVVAPGTDTTLVDPQSSQDGDLIARGLLVEQATTKTARPSTTTQKEAVQ